MHNCRYADPHAVPDSSTPYRCLHYHSHRHHNPATFINHISLTPFFFFRLPYLPRAWHRQLPPPRRIPSVNQGWCIYETPHSARLSPPKPSRDLPEHPLPAHTLPHSTRVIAGSKAVNPHPILPQTLNRLPPKLGIFLHTQTPYQVHPGTEPFSVRRSGQKTPSGCPHTQPHPRMGTTTRWLGGGARNRKGRKKGNGDCGSLSSPGAARRKKEERRKIHPTITGPG